MQLHAGLHGEEWGVEQATTATGARAEEGEQGGEEGALEAYASRVRRRLRYEEAAAPGVGPTWTSVDRSAQLASVVHSVLGQQDSKVWMGVEDPWNMMV